MPDHAAIAAVPSHHGPEAHHSRLALSDAKRHLQKSALKLMGYLVAAYLVLRLVPTLEKALHSLDHVSWEWLVGAIALEVVSETGFVVAWRGIVDPERVLERDGRGHRMDQRVAWAQLGGGLLVPGGSLGGMGVGGWFLHRFGMPAKQIAERQFTLSFLNTAVSALALIVFGIGLAARVFAGKHNLLLTLLPAAVAAAGIAAALLIAPRASTYAEQLRAKHPKIASSITALADAVADTRTLFHRGGWRSVLGAVDLPRIRGARPLERVPRHPRAPGPWFRRRRDGLRNRRARWIASPARRHRDDRRHRRDAHRLWPQPQPGGRCHAAPPGNRTARAADRRDDRLPDPSPTRRPDTHQRRPRVSLPLVRRAGARRAAGPSHPRVAGVAAQSARLRPVCGLVHPLPERVGPRLQRVDDPSDLVLRP